MFWDYLENTLQLSVTVVMLLVCLLQYIGSRKRAWFYLVVFFLGTLVSSYHWTAYLLIMGESPCPAFLYRVFSSTGSSRKKEKKSFFFRNDSCPFYDLTYDSAGCSECP